MSVQSSCEFSVEDVPSNVSWYGIYAALRRYGPVIEVNSVDPHPQDPLMAWPDTTEATFTLANTNETDKLKVLRKLSCGTANIAIKWSRDPRTRRGYSTDACDIDVKMEAVEGRSPSVPSPTSTPPPTSPPAPPPLESSAEILNDDCLREILEFDVFSAQDLCAFGRTCTRFQSIAQQEFQARSRVSAINLCSSQWSLSASEVLFQDFGHLILSAYVADDSSIRTDIMLGFMAQYCPNIVHLACSRMRPMALAVDGYKRLPAERQQCIAVPFGRLQHLEYMPRVNSINTLPAVHLPSLRYLAMSNASLIDREKTRSFFAINRTLTVLRLHRTFMFHHISDIIEHTTNLLELEVDHVTWGYDTQTLEKDLECFGRLSELTHFECTPLFLDLTNPILAAMRNGNVPIRQLKLRLPLYPDIIEQMPTIEDLRIIGLRPVDIPLLAAFVGRNSHLKMISNGLAGWKGLHGFRLEGLPEIEG